jgi:gas vesicle protein
MNLTPSAFLYLLEIVALVTGAAAVLVRTYRTTSSSIDKETIDRLTNAINALKEENQILKQENVGLKEKIDGLTKTIEQNGQAIHVLQGVITGKEEIARLVSEIQGLKNSIDIFLTK